MLEEFDLDTCTTLHVVVCVCVSKPGSVMWRIRRSCLMSIVLSEVRKHEFCLCVPVYVNRREKVCPCTLAFNIPRSLSVARGGPTYSQNAITN